MGVKASAVGRETSATLLFTKLFGKAFAGFVSMKNGKSSTSSPAITGSNARLNIPDLSLAPIELRKLDLRLTTLPRY